MVKLRAINTSGGGGGAGVVSDGLGSWSNLNNEDFSVTVNDGTKTVTVNGFALSLESKNIFLAAAIIWPATGLQANIPLTTVTVSGDVITFVDKVEDFAAGDSVLLVLRAKLKAYLAAVNALNTSLINPAYAHYTDPEPIVAETDLGIDGVHDGGGVSDIVFIDSSEVYTAETVAEGYLIHNVNQAVSGLINIGGAGDPSADDIAHAATGAPWSNAEVASIPEVKRFEFDFQSFLILTGQYKITAGANNICHFKIYGTLKEAADVTDDTSWVNLSEAVLGDAAGITVAAGNTVEDSFTIDRSSPYLKFMLKIVAECSDAVQSNAFDIDIVKAFS
jgi:hypothetical protein